MDKNKFTVKRSDWARGKDDGALLNDKGHRCILGFYGQALGIPDDKLLNNGEPP